MPSSAYISRKTATSRGQRWKTGRTLGEMRDLRSTVSSSPADDMLIALADEGKKNTMYEYSTG